VFERPAESTLGRETRMTVSPGICVMLKTADLDRLAPPPCMDVCLVCGSDQVHGQACIATRLFRTIARLGNRGIRRSEIPVVDAAFLKACGIAPGGITTLKQTPEMPHLEC
jgi:hypothetical protein